MTNAFKIAGDINIHVRKLAIVYKCMDLDDLRLHAVQHKRNHGMP